MNDSIQVKIQETLLGRQTTDIQIVVITPITSAFNMLSARLNISEVHKCGFFHNSCFQTENRLNGMIISIPQGIGAQDVMYVFSDADVIFYGYAGSLVDDITIGSIVEVGTAINPEGVGFPLKVTGTYNDAVCGYSPCLLGNIAYHHCEQARLAGCQVVDMETVYCAHAAIQNTNRFTARLVISDIPESINFWELNKGTKAYFKQKCADALENIVLYLNSFIKEEK